VALALAVRGGHYAIVYYLCEDLGHLFTDYAVKPFSSVEKVHLYTKVNKMQLVIHQFYGTKSSCRKALHGDQFFTRQLWQTHYQSFATW